MQERKSVDGSVAGWGARIGGGSRGIITAIFSIALGRRKCYYSTRFKESDSWDML